MRLTDAGGAEGPGPVGRYAGVRVERSRHVGHVLDARVVELTVVRERERTLRLNDTRTLHERA